MQKNMASQNYKMQGKKGLFDEQFTIGRLSETGNPLEKISNVIDFESFRSTIEEKLLNTNKKNNAGSKPYVFKSGRDRDGWKVNKPTKNIRK